MISQINNEERDYKLEAYDYLLDPSLIASKPTACLLYTSDAADE